MLKKENKLIYEFHHKSKNMKSAKSCELIEFLTNGTLGRKLGNLEPTTWQIPALWKFQSQTCRS